MSQITQSKIGGILGDLNVAGERRAIVMLLPDGETIEAVLGYAGQAMPVSIGGIDAQPDKAVGVMAELFLLDDVTMDDVRYPDASTSYMNTAGTRFIALPLGDGESMSITAVVGGKSVTVNIGGISARLPDDNGDGTITTYTVLAVLKATLTDQASPEGLG